MHTDNHWNDEASKLCPVLGAGELTRTNHECFPCQTFPTYQGWQLSCIPRGRWIQEGLLLALSHWGAVSWFEDTVLLIIKGSLLFWLRIHQGIMSMVACLFAFQWDWRSQVLFQAGLWHPDKAVLLYHVKPMKMLWSWFSGELTMKAEIRTAFLNLKIIRTLLVFTVILCSQYLGLWEPFESLAEEWC